MSDRPSDATRPTESNSRAEGSNLPRFQALQMDFAAYIRDPDNAEPPPGIEPRRLAIYQDLFYRNVERFCATAFPIAKQILGDERWHTLVRDFLRRNPSESPYFLEISQEFLAYLDRFAPPDVPAFLLELCHYEWVELRVRVTVEESDPTGVETVHDAAAWLGTTAVLSTAHQALTYRYPVQRLGVDFQPERPPEQPTHLIVYRNGAERVRFMESNALTVRLLQLIAEEPVDDALGHLQAELPQLSEPKIISGALDMLMELQRRGIILGAR